MRNLIIGGYNVLELAKKTGKEVIDDNLLSLAGSAAYYFFFSLFPLLLFLAPILSFLGEQEAVLEGIMAQIAPIVPVDARAVIEATLEDVVFTENAPALMSLGALLAAFAGSTVIAMLTGALNVAYEVGEPRSWWKRRLVALVFVVVGGVVVLSATFVLVAGEQIVGWLGAQLGFPQLAAQVLVWLQYPVTFAVIVALLWTVYYVLPPIRQQKKLVLVGALVAATLWVLVTLLLRLYVTHIAQLNRTYGTIGGIIVLLMWMYLTMLVILTGGELNSELRRGTGKTGIRDQVSGISDGGTDKGGSRGNQETQLLIPDN